MSTRAKLMERLLKSGTDSVRKNKPQLREAAKKKKWDIVRGDTVQVISRNHPEFRKQGVVLEVNRKADRITVEGVNFGPFRMKGDKERGIRGQTITKERSLHYSNVNLVDPVTGKPTRITKQYLEDGTKVRVAKKSGAVIPRPEILTLRKRPMSQVVTASCTGSDEDVW
eukprot:CAMPEP_0197840002 /NCGR_PEP_ID=MMETSP1437-20131217/45351_1 /TAXON_ID=49252 ORGANISM="Eucampia antarctica, Strain CCMP1452" /NCGR_SAMPLE_ID=MMETSP1437 /ASSEMBLY_ACC=CAM_ASM_001096 /LENGTH=168 /DNA_ID=CAMNT_0043449541 /DNA_START=247 /DNA_END=750 /DNA_ORIENTATION=+